jgi:hypothetical protein
MKCANLDPPLILYSGTKYNPKSKVVEHSFRNDFIPLSAVKTYISGILSALLVATDVTR